MPCIKCDAGLFYFVNSVCLQVLGEGALEEIVQGFFYSQSRHSLCSVGIPTERKGVSGKTTGSIFMHERRDKEKRLWRDNMRRNIEETILPLIERMKKRGSPSDQKNLMLLERSLQSLAGSFEFTLMDRKWRLSVREIEICKMLKNDCTTKDVAEMLNISERTIDHHRNHIRKKLGISRAVDLAKYLKKFFL